MRRLLTGVMVFVVALLCGCGDNDDPGRLPTVTPTVLVSDTPGQGRPGFNGTPNLSETETAAAAPTPTITPIPQSVLRISSTMGLPGETVVLTVTLAAVAPGARIAATQNDVYFAPLIPIAANAAGDPDCTVNPAIHRNATRFAFECDFPCNRMRAIVIDFSNLTPIPSGSVLYTCTVTIPAVVPLDALAPGEVAEFSCANWQASDPVGESVPIRCESGQIQLVLDSSTPTPVQGT